MGQVQNGSLYAKTLCNLTMGLFTFSHSLTGAIALARAYIGHGEGPILLDDVHCFGSEANLLSCVSSPVYSHNCQHSEDAGVSCQS